MVEIIDIVTLERTSMKTAGHETKAPAAWLALVEQQVGSMRFGVVQIVVHESRVVQIERTERVRLDAVPSSTSHADRIPGGSTER